MGLLRKSFSFFHIFLNLSSFFLACCNIPNNIISYIVEGVSFSDPSGKILSDYHSARGKQQNILNFHQAIFPSSITNYIIFSDDFPSISSTFTVFILTLLMIMYNLNAEIQNYRKCKNVKIKTTRGLRCSRH